MRIFRSGMSVWYGWGGFCYVFRDRERLDDIGCWIKEGVSFKFLGRWRRVYLNCV